MDPLTAVFLLATWFAARSSEEFAAEFGKDAYTKVQPLVNRLMERLSRRDDAAELVPEVERGEFSDTSIAALSEILEEDSVFFGDFSNVTELVRQKQFNVELDLEGSHDVVALRAPSSTAADAHIVMRVKGSNNIRGIDLT